MSTAQSASLLNNVLQNAAHIIASLNSHFEHITVEDLLSCLNCAPSFSCVHHIRVNSCITCMNTIVSNLDAEHSRVKQLFFLETSRIEQRLRDANQPATLAAAQSLMLALQRNYSGLLQISKLRELQQILVNTQSHAGNLKLTVTADNSGELGLIATPFRRGHLYCITESIRLRHIEFHRLHAAISEAL